MGLVFLLCLASVPLAGGRLGALADVRLRAQGIISVVPQGSAGLHGAVHVATYVLVAGFVAANRKLPWVWLVALGGALNLAAVAANGGVMPASARALDGAGLAIAPTVYTNSGVLADPHLAFLGDVFWVPASWPASNVFSVGDVLILVGALLALHCICASRIALRRFAVPAV
jgi:hypothetical protein